VSDGIQHRKSEHLRIVAELPVQHAGGTLLDGVRLVHQALPELGLADIDTSCEFFGKRLSAPLMITSMTGGADFAGELNRGLAMVAQSLGIAFAVGSQRVLWRHPETLQDFAVRSLIPDGVLLGNIGMAQLVTEQTNRLVGLVEAIEADGLCVHLNAAQELIQPDGDRNFAGTAAALGELVQALDGRVLVKETGAGLSRRALEQLRACGVRYVDVSGSGGTSWTKVEMHRLPAGPERVLGALLADWGIPTAVSLHWAREVYCQADSSELVLIGSGGITTGLDAARAIACGADIAGVARTVMLAFLEGGTDGARQYLVDLIEQLRAVMLLCAAPNIAAMQSAERSYSAELRDWLAS
jgi:isopentenyl-diphosphate delta-isomerase